MNVITLETLEWLLEYYAATCILNQFRFVKEKNLLLYGIFIATQASA